MLRWIKNIAAISMVGFSAMAVAAPETLLWSTKLGGNISSSVAIGTHLYVGTADGKLQAINPTTGAVVWTFTTGDHIGATPAVSADSATVYVASYDKNIYAVSTADGKEKWHFTTDAPVFSSPVLDELGAIYVFSTSGRIYVINPVTGESEGEYPFGSSVDGSPAVLSSGTTTEIFCGTEGGYVSAVNLDNGAGWTFNSSREKAMSSPVIGPDKNIYVGSHDGHIYALNHADGSLMWERELNGRVAASSSINKNTLYVASYDFGTVYALDTFGGQLWWEYHTGGEVFSTPAVSANGKIYIGTESKLLALNESNGTLAWSYTTDSPVASSPVISSTGNVYAITQNGTLLALTGNGSTLAPSSWAMFRQNNQRNGMLRDADGDGLPDSWETFYGISNAGANSDGDALTNLQEYLAGTAPNVTDTDGDGSNDAVDIYPTRAGTPTSFQALADRMVTRASNAIVIPGKDLLANDSNPAGVSLSITATNNTTNTNNTKPTVSSGNLSYNPATEDTEDEFAYTLSGGGNTRLGLVAAKIVASTADVVGSAYNDIVFAGGNTHNTDAGQGNDIIYDDADGDDIYLQGESDGNDRLFINDNTSNRSDVLKFKSNIADEQVSFYKDGRDLVVHVREQDSHVTVVEGIFNAFLNNITAVQYANGVDAALDMKQIQARDDYINAVSYGGIIYLMPDSINLLTQNDFIPAGTQFSFDPVVDSETGGSVVANWWFIGKTVEFTLDTGTSNASFKYILKDLSGTGNTTTATVHINVIGSEITTGIVFDGTADDDILEGTPGADTFYGGPGYDILDGVAGEDTVGFATGNDKDTYRYMFDDGGFQTGDGASDYGDTLSLTTYPRSQVSLERDGLDLVAKVKGSWDSIRLQEYFAQESTINFGALNLPRGLLPFKKIDFSDSSISAYGFTPSANSALIAEAMGNATVTCNVGGVNNQLCIGTSGSDTSDSTISPRTGFNITGGTGRDIVYAMEGKDNVVGGSGNDSLYGGLGDDILKGELDDDELYGDQGSDWLYAGGGSNYMNGGSGVDYYVLDYDSSTNIIDNFDLTTGANEATRDVIYFPNSPAIDRSQVTFRRVDDDLIIKVKLNSTTYSTSTVPDYFSFSGYNIADFKFKTVNNAATVVWDGNCIDYSKTTQLETGVSFQSGVVDYYCLPIRVLYDMTHDDTCNNPVLDDDIIYGYDIADTIDGNCGNDTIYAGQGADTVNGGPGNDTIYPYWGGDIIDGGSGDDVLYGSVMYGVASLTGGSGSDTYIFKDNQYGYIHAVQASDSGVDIIELNNVDLAPHDYWLHAVDADADSNSDDMAISIIGSQDQAYIINWSDTDNQVDWIKVDVAGNCQKMSRSAFSSYLSAIVTVVGSGTEPTTAQMDTVIGGGSYWQACQ